jgi:hypothetical protein
VVDKAIAKGPFCSERCRMADLGRWLNEEYRIPDQPDTKGGGADAIPDPDAERS